ncbi:MAG: hypothetical protein IPI73_04390 [Betaproteobacteria bacterium]|nr:hypothetical protein [Betaproteobacteria bacterium]
MKNTALLAHIRQLCCLGLGGRAIMPALLKAARELVPSDSAEFFWVDARGEMTNHYAERMLPADAMQFYFRQPDAAGEHPLFASFRTRAAQPDPVTTLSVTDAFRRSDHYRTVMQHFGAEHALYCVVRSATARWASSRSTAAGSARLSAAAIAPQSPRSPATSRTASTKRSAPASTPPPTRPGGTPTTRRCSRWSATARCATARAPRAGCCST